MNMYVVVVVSGRNRPLAQRPYLAGQSPLNESRDSLPLVAGGSVDPPGPVSHNQIPTSIFQQAHEICIGQLIARYITFKHVAF